MSETSETIEAVYRQHGSIVLRRARSLLGNNDEANDVLQEIFTSLVERPEQFRGESTWTTFLYAATTNACLKRIHRHKNRTRLVELFVKPMTVTQVDAAGDAQVLVRALLSRSPDDEAAAAVYAWVDGMTWDEIAVVMNCSRRHVGNLLSSFKERAAKSTARAA